MFGGSSWKQHQERRQQQIKASSSMQAGGLTRNCRLLNDPSSFTNKLVSKGFLFQNI